MNTDHISDERILEVLDQMAAPFTAAEMDHLSQCPGCTKLHSEYSRLYPGLAELPIEVLPKDFSLRVIERLPKVSATAAMKSEPGLAVIIIGLGLMTIGLLIGLQSFYGVFSAFFGQMRAMLGSFGQQLERGKPLLGIITPDLLHLLLFSLLTLASVALLDHLLSRKYHLTGRS